MQGHYHKHVKPNLHANENMKDEVINVDWEVEMKESTFHNYDIGQLPFESCSWNDINYVS